MSLAEQARAAVRARPFVHEALRAGVLNNRAAARLLDIEGEPEAIATALRRYEETLDPPAAAETPPVVRLERDVGIGTSPKEDPLLAVDDLSVTTDGEYAAVLVTGMQTTLEYARAVTRLAFGESSLRATGGTFPPDGQGTAVFIVPATEGTDALRDIEATFGERPTGSNVSLR